MSIPFGCSKEKLPIGIQLSSKHFEENKIFSLAKFIGQNIQGNK